MKTRRLTAALMIWAACWTSAASAFDETRHGHVARRLAARYPWHDNYYHIDHGQPLALVVPPTAEYQTDYAWGAAGSHMTRLNHQYQRPYPGPYPRRYGFRATPPWPSHTRQFGVYSVRSPW